MTHYLINFSVYTLAMVGVILVALFAFKTFANGGFSKKSSNLKIEDSMTLSARKTLYVINAGNERFLIASDVDKTALIAKLEPNSKDEEEMVFTRADKSSQLKSADGVESITDFASLIDMENYKSGKGPMMRELAKKLRS